MSKGPAARAALTWIALCGLLGSCDECREYSSYSCKQIETADYNVIFYFQESGTEQYLDLGQAKGLSQCGQRAHGFAASKNLSRGDNWSYVCCMIAKGSSCYEKHR
jgi:hypothetical protein